MRGAWWLGGVLVVAGAVWGVGAQVKSPTQRAAEAQAPEPAVITAPVEERRLVEAVTVRGTVRSSQEAKVVLDVAVEDRKPLVTKVPLKADASVGNGALLVEVAGRPVFALRGRVPMYRDLRVGDRGDDVAQLQQGLGGGGDRAGVFGPGTAASVKSFFAARGYETSAEDSPEPEEEEGDSAEPRARLVVKADEVLFFRALPARVAALSVRVGDRAEGEAMRLSAGRPRVEVAVDDAVAGAVRPGRKAEIRLDGKTFAGRVGNLVRGRAGKDGSPSLTAIITPAKPLPGRLLGREATTRIIARDSGRAVPAVPSAAVWTRADGETYLVVQDDGGGSREVKVTVGEPSDGYVELVDAGGVVSGDRVVLSGS